MADLKAITTFLGIDEADANDLENFKKKFGEKFVHVDHIAERKDLYQDMINAEIGNVKGSIETAIKKAARAEGLDFTKDDVTGKKTEEFAAILINKAKTKYEGTIADLTEKVGKNSDEVVKGWEKKYGDLEKSLNDHKSLVETTTTKYETLQNETGTKIKSFQIDYAKKDEMGKLNFRSDIKAIEREGFNAIISNNYDLDFDEKEGLVVRDKKGKRIADEKVTGKFKTFNQVLTEHAEKEGLLPKNPHAGKTTAKLFDMGQQNNGNGQNGQNNNSNGNGQPVRRVSSRVKA